MKKILSPANILFLLGFIVVSFSSFLYIFLETGSYVQVYDQLDGEVLNYIYQAKYFFQSGNIAEFMNGMPKASMTLPAPFMVIFYLFLEPFTAFAWAQFFVMIAGYISMYFLLLRITDTAWIAMIVACMFAYIPFYPVYGLYILGQPMLIIAIWNLYLHKKKTLSYILIILYTGFSSLSLIGFAWLGLGMIALITLAVKKKLSTHLEMIWAYLLMLFTYLLTNIDLIYSVLFNNTFISHRMEMKVQSVPFISNVWNLFCNGGGYAPTHNLPIFIFVVIVLLYCLITKNKSRHFGMLNLLLISCLLISILAGIWRCQWILSIRERIGGVLYTFQADRIYWILPVLWYLILGISIKLLISSKDHIPGFIKCVCSFIPIIIVSLNIFQDSNINRNLRLLLQPGYARITWNDIYDEEIYSEIDNFIGKDKSTYRVLSLGVYPSAALYFGFYCLDGYSNNYNLDYKHEFRNIIGSEIEKSDVIKAYFDDWGNRCYLMTLQSGSDSTISKVNGVIFTDLSFNMEYAKNMGCQYLFSAAPLDQPEKIGLKLCRETPFTTDHSYYAIYLYELI